MPEKQLEAWATHEAVLHGLLSENTWWWSDMAVLLYRKLERNALLDIYVNGGNQQLNGSRNITKGITVRFLRAGEWEAGVVENVILSRYRGTLYKEVEVRLGGGYRTWAQIENLAPVPTFLERLQKIARPCEREQSDNGHLSQPGLAQTAL
jgi:hypothetical protein